MVVIKNSNTVYAFSDMTVIENLFVIVSQNDFNHNTLKSHSIMAFSIPNKTWLKLPHHFDEAMKNAVLVRAGVLK